MRSSAISSEITEFWGTWVNSSTVQKYPVRSGLQGRTVAKNPYMETRSTTKLCKETLINGVQKNGSRCSGPMIQNKKYLAVEECSLCAEGLESGTVTSVCRQPWSMVEVLGKFEVAFLQTEFGICSGSTVSITLTASCNTKEGGVWLALQQCNSLNHTSNVIKNTFRVRNSRSPGSHDPPSISDLKIQKIWASLYLIS